MADEFNKEIKSNRLLQSLRYTAAAQDNQEAYTRVLDLNASEIYTQENHIPSGSLPYSSSGQHLEFITANIDGSDVNIAQYFFEITCSRSSRDFGSSKSEVWLTISGSGYDPVATNTGVGIGSSEIEPFQLTNFISNKYTTASLALSNAENNPPGYNVLVKINGSNAPLANYQFDYKTGILQFVNNSVSPSETDIVTITGYRYVGQTLNEFISTGGGSGTPGGATTQVQFNDGGAFGGSEKFTFNKTTGLTTLTGSFEITGSVDNIFLIKSGSIDLLRMSSSGALVFGDLQHTPPPVAGGMFYSASNFYVGTE
jgi:hypothetical protein